LPHEPAAPEDSARLAREAGVHPIVAEILLRRGIATAEAARRFLHPSLGDLHDPFLLQGMDAAVARILKALGAGERIVVSGDYDVDGVTSSAMLTHFLRAAGCADLHPFIPNRFSHGYGLTTRTVDALLELKPSLVVTVDNGITAIAEVARLHGAGVDTVITDHHLPRAEGVPPGIVVNPVQPGCPYPFKRLSGCGVTLKLMTALRGRLREGGWWSPARPEPNLKDYLDLVAIGTVADVVPLLEENRILAHHGLTVLNRPRRRPGVAALLAVSRVDRAVSAQTIAFKLAPRLNAAGRMADGSLGVALLLEEDPARAAELAAQLDLDNRERRAKGEEMFEDAARRIAADGTADAPAIVVASPDFHEGISGIVATRLVERYDRPTVVLAENGAHYKGSARSVPGLDVTAAIAACAPLLTEYGGHPGAAGCKLPKENLADFRAGFLAACVRLQAQTPPPALRFDARLDPAALDPAFVEQVLRLEPCGQDNAAPSFLVEGADLPAPPRVVAERHLKWALSGRAEMMAFNQAQHLPLPATARYRVSLGFNEFRGERKVQLNVEEILAGE
jgi:single-stranded-DNA-specific exonuclease